MLLRIIISLTICCGLCGVVCADSALAAGESARGRCFVIDLYVGDDDSASQQARDHIAAFVAKHPGYLLRQHHVATDRAAEQRLQQLAKFFKVPATPPLAYVAAICITNFAPADKLASQLQSATTMTLFKREGCPHCRAAKAFLPNLSREYAALRFELIDIVTDVQGRQQLQSLAQKYRVAAASVPVFYSCEQLLVGFSSEASTGAQLRTLLNRWTRPCAKQTSQINQPYRNWLLVEQILSPVACLGCLLAVDEPAKDDASLPLPLPEEALDDLPLPADETANSPPEEAPDAIELPLLGRLSARQLGLPLFTVAVGLIDGFNPCAMWVLLFLLSVLVNLHSRWKILAVAGTFVAISAMAYFGFMAAWFSVFQYVGMLRSVQVALACAAIVIGSVHVKDFFALHRGISFSIPESAKPGIYERVRRIVTAENLVGAVLAAAVLAVLVNLIELLCTAGLPALYTQILSARELPAWKNYAYLLLYNLAYMFDDIVMVSLVVITLEKRKLQETQGRWLKLISGLAIAGLGVVMLVRPHWLGM